MKILPPGQKESSIFPRFGLPQYANRFPKQTDHIAITIGGDIEEFVVTKELEKLTRRNQNSDFHCVTTWSKLNCNWSGYSFKDIYDNLIHPRSSEKLNFVVLKAQDGFKTDLPLEDLLQSNVILADHLDGHPLTIEHGAPIRLVVPDHYGYKNVKHINRIEFYSKPQNLKRGIWKFMDHPRARVAYEERARSGPAIFFRWLYKIGINGTIKDFEKAMKTYRRNKQNSSD